VKYIRTRPAAASKQPETCVRDASWLTPERMRVARRRGRKLDFWMVMMIICGLVGLWAFSLGARMISEFIQISGTFHSS
jgi:hypothetical protein